MRLLRMRWLRDGRQCVLLLLLLLVLMLLMLLANMVGLQGHNRRVIVDGQRWCRDGRRCERRLASRRVQMVHLHLVLALRLGGAGRFGDWPRLQLHLNRWRLGDLYGHIGQYIVSQRLQHWFQLLQLHLGALGRRCVRCRRRRSTGGDLHLHLRRLALHGLHLLHEKLGGLRVGRLCHGGSR